MKMFRPALAGALPAFVLLVCIELNARAASTPLPPDTRSWFTGERDAKTPYPWASVRSVRLRCGHTL